MRMRSAAAIVCMVVGGLAPSIAGASPSAEERGGGADLLPGRFFRVAQAGANPTPTPQPTSSPQPQATPAPETTDETDPEYIFHDRPKRFPPLFWYEVSPERRSRFFMLGMLWWSGENPEREYHALVPFFYHRRNKTTEGHTYISPLFYWWRSPRGRAGYIFPVYFERTHGTIAKDGTRGPDDVNRIGVPPLFWYGRVGEDKTSYLAPLYFYVERDRYRVLATPIGGGWGDRNDFQGLVGLYYWRNAHYANYDLDAHVLFPLFWHVRTGKKDALGSVNTWVAGPLFHRTRNAAGGKKKHAYGVFPLFYRRTSPDGGATTVGPLFVHEARDESNSFLVTPIGGFSKAPGRATVVIGPWVDRYDRGERFRAFFPLYFHGSGPLHDEYDGRRLGRYSWTVVGPYFDRTRRMQSADGKYESVQTDRALLPLFYYGRSGKDVRFLSPGVLFRKKENGNFWLLAGPWWQRRSGPSSTWVLLPGIWRHTNTETRASGFGVLPVYYWHREKDDSTVAGLFPVFFHQSRLVEHEGQQKRRRFQALLPLYFYSERPDEVTFVSPLYWQFRNPYERRIMAGWLYWDRKGRDHRSTTLFPLYHYARYGETRTLFTLAGGYSSGPGYSTHLWGPFYRRLDTERGIDDRVLFPLYWDLNRPGDRKLFLLPYYRIKQGSYHTEGFVPFWFHSSYPGASQTVVLPLFLWRHDKVEKTRTLFTPIGGYWKQEDPEAFRVLAPLVYLARGPQKRTTVLFPIFWYDYDRGKQTVAIPPFYTRRTKDSVVATLLPIFWYSRNPAQTLFLSLPGILHARDEREHTTAILPLLYFWERSPQHSRGIAGPWLWSKRLDVRDEYTRVLFPLMYWSRQGSRMTLLSPLLVRSEKGRRAMTFIPGFGWASRWNGKGEVISRATLVGPLYVRYAPKAADVVLFPIFWHTHQPGRSVNAVLPLFHHEKRGEAWRLITPLGGGFHDPVEQRTWAWILNTYHYRWRDESRTLVFPLFYRRSSDRESMWVLPLFFHHADRVAETSTTLAPLFYRVDSPQRKTWVFFPLAWHNEYKETGARSGAFLPFAFWYGDRDRHWTLMPLLLSYYERRGDDRIGVYGPFISTKIRGKTTKALIPVFRYQSDDQADTASFISLPFIVWLRRGEETRAFWGLGYWNTETGTAVAPFWARFQQRREDGTVRRHTEVSWPLPIYVRHKTAKRELVVVAPFYRISRPDGSRVHGIAPIWSEELKPSRTVEGKRLPSEHSWSVLGDLVGYDRVGRYRRLTLLFGLHFPLKSLPPKRTARAALEGGLELPPMFPREEQLAVSP